MYRQVEKSEIDVEKLYRQVVDEGEQEKERGICRKESFPFVPLFIALLVIAVIWLFLTILANFDLKHGKNSSTSTNDELETLLKTCRNLAWNLKKRINETIDAKTESKEKEEFREKTKKFVDCGQKRNDGKLVKELEKKIEFLETLLKSSEGGGQVEVNVDLSSGNTHYYRHYHYQNSVSSVSWLCAFFISTLVLL